MNMAIKVSTTTVIDNAFQLQNIASVDGTTGTVIVATIRAEGHSLSVRDSAGNETFKIFGVPA